MSLFSDWKFNGKESQFKIHPGKGVCLDLGCGDGRFRCIVENAGWRYIGCDLDISRGGAMLQCDGILLPFKNNCFDAIIIWQVLEHVKDPMKLLLEINRVLVQGGQIYGSASFLEPFHDKCVYFGFSKNGIESILREAGFVNIELKSGVNAFSLILRGLLIRLLPKRLGEIIAFYLSKIGVISLIYAIFLCRAIISLIKRGRLSDCYNNSYKYIMKTAPFDFAGHIQFIATTKK